MREGGRGILERDRERDGAIEEGGAGRGNREMGRVGVEQ